MSDEEKTTETPPKEEEKAEEPEEPKEEESTATFEPVVGDNHFLRMSYVDSSTKSLFFVLTRF
jgi:hypothetical protein